MHTPLEQHTIPAALDLFTKTGTHPMEETAEKLRSEGYGGAAVYTADMISSVMRLKEKRTTAPEGIIPIPSAIRADGNMSDIGLLARQGERLLCVPENFENTDRLRKLFCYASDFGVRIAISPTLSSICEKGQINEGLVSDRLGIKAIPPIAELIAAQTAMAFAAEWGTPLHLRGVTCAKTLAAIASAQKNGQDVTCDAPILNLLLDETIYTPARLDPRIKPYPPLRAPSDRKAIWDALENGTVTALTTGYSPRSGDMLALPFEQSPFGSERLDNILGDLFDAWEKAKRPCSLGRLLYALSEGPSMISSFVPRGKTVLTKTEHGWNAQYRAE